MLRFSAVSDLTRVQYHKVQLKILIPILSFDDTSYYQCYCIQCSQNVFQTF